MNRIFTVAKIRLLLLFLIGVGTMLLPLAHGLAQETATSTTGEFASSSTTTIPVTTSTTTATSTDTEVTTPGPDRREQLMNSRQMPLESFRQERIINLGANLSNRMEAVIERLFNIITRLESRISKLAGSGMEVRSATAELRNATTLLTETRTLLTDIDLLVYNAATSPEPYTAWQAVKDRYVVVAENIRTVHTALRTTISLLKNPLPQTELAPDPSDPTTPVDTAALTE